MGTRDGMNVADYAHIAFSRRLWLYAKRSNWKSANDIPQWIKSHVAELREGWRFLFQYSNEWQYSVQYCH